jgi:hypothetical protein
VEAAAAIRRVVFAAIRRVASATHHGVEAAAAIRAEYAYRGRSDRTSIGSPAVKGGISSHPVWPEAERVGFLRQPRPAMTTGVVSRVGVLWAISHELGKSTWQAFEVRTSPNAFQT